MIFQRAPNFYSSNFFKNLNNNKRRDDADYRNYGQKRPESHVSEKDFCAVPVKERKHVKKGVSQT